VVGESQTDEDGTLAKLFGGAEEIAGDSAGAPMKAVSGTEGRNGREERGDSEVDERSQPGPPEADRNRDRNRGR